MVSILELNQNPKITFDNPTRQNNKTSILVSFDTTKIRYYGFDVATYRKRAYSYRYPSQYVHLLSWLLRNGEGWEEIGGRGDTSEKSKLRYKAAVAAYDASLLSPPAAAKVVPSSPAKVAAPPTTPQTKARVPTIKGAMMLKVAEQCEKSGYTMQTKGKSVDTRKCPKCLDASLLGAKKADKFIVICLNRYNPDVKKQCTYTKKYTKK